MGYYLIVLIIVAILSIAYAWYISNSFNSIVNDKPLLLDTEEDHILSSWYQYNIKQILSLHIDENQLASLILKRIYNIDISPNILIIGSDISSQYKNIKGSYPSYNYLPNNAHGKKGSATDYIFNLRDSIGKNIEIAVIPENKTRNILEMSIKNNTTDITDLYSIVNGELDIIASNYLKEVLKYRWDKILELNDPNLLNDTGSYLYLRDCVIPNVQTATTIHGIRINLLCKDSDFESLIKRWKNNLQEIPIPIGNIM